MAADLFADAPAAVQFDGVAKSYPDGTVAVANLDLTIAAEELLVLVGPSGCGKSTTMRMVNRLVAPSSGRILVAEHDVAKVDPVALRRRIGYVIQHVGLFPHRTVAQNVATVPRLLGWARGRIAARTAELLQLVGLDPDRYGSRYPHELSGGEQQRVGVARALAANPPLLLMDEPFGAVDPIGRRRLQSEFRRIQQQVRTTVLFVTHDIDEAMLLGDRVAVLSQGAKVEQVADPISILARPATPYVSEFVGGAAAVRLLALGKLTDADLSPVVTGNGARGEIPGEEGGATLRLGQSLDTAFDALAKSDRDEVTVLSGDGKVAGVLSAAALQRAVRRLISQHHGPTSQP